MEEYLIKALEDFGLTTKQAKVYLTIVRAGSISVGEIAKISKIYQQDVYKILPKLEEMGLVTKTIDSPIIVRAIKAENALKSIVALKRKVALDKVERMENAIQRIIDAVSEWQKGENRDTKEESRFVLLNGENEAMNVADELFRKASLQVDLVLNLDLLTVRATKFRERFQTATSHSVKTRLIVEHPSKIEKIDAIVKLVTPKSKNFASKFLQTKTPKPFQIIDHRDIWITRREKLPSGFPYVFWTNSADIIEVYEERFEKLWNDPKSVDISETKEKGN